MSTDDKALLTQALEDDNETSLPARTRWPGRRRAAVYETQPPGPLGSTPLSGATHEVMALRAALAEAAGSVTPAAALVVGTPAHLVVLWVHLSTGRIYFVAVCGARGESATVPAVLSDDRAICRLCFSGLSEAAA